MEENMDYINENSPYCRGVLLVSILTSGFTVGNMFTCLNPLVSVITEVFRSTYYERNEEYPTPTKLTTLVSVAVSMSIVGGFFGSISVSHVLKIINRKQTMILCNWVGILGNIIVSVGAGLTGSYEAFIVGRFVTGFGCGLAIVTFPVVVAELCARRYQQKFQSLIGVSASIGNVFGVVFSHPKVLGTRELWPWAIACGCLPSLVYLCYSPWSPETPYSLLRKNERGKALKVLRKLRTGSQESVNNEMEQMEKEQCGYRSEETECTVDDVFPEKRSYVGIKAILKTPQYRLQFLIALILYCGMTFTGVNHVLLYSNEVFKSSGIPDDIVSYATVGVFGLQTFASLLGVKLITIYGGRKLILFSLGGCIISHIITTIGLVTSGFWTYSGFVSIIGILTFLISLSVGVNVSTVALASDITIEPTRQTVLNYAGGSLWISSWMVGFCAPYMDASLHGYSFLVWCGITVFTWFLIYWLVPETKGRTTKEIQSELSH